MSDALPSLPSVEAVECGRSVLLYEVERLRKFERESVNGEHRRRLANWIEYSLLGSGEGCVITAFDARKLDPEWRAWWDGVGTASRGASDTNTRERE